MAEVAEVADGDEEVSEAEAEEAAEGSRLAHLCELHYGVTRFRLEESCRRKLEPRTQSLVRDYDSAVLVERRLERAALMGDYGGCSVSNHRNTTPWTVDGRDGMAWLILIKLFRTWVCLARGAPIHRREE